MQHIHGALQKKIIPEVVNLVILTPVRDKSMTYGYTIEHNQPIGWAGTTGRTFAWYRFKRDAAQRCVQLMKSYNNRS